MRIAVYGGSFNPPHLGHVEAAKTVARTLAPDRFLIVPAAVPPHKALAEDSPSPEQRMELCRMAFAETKAPGMKLRPLQAKRKAQLESLGFRVFVIDGTEQIEGVLDEIQAS